MASPPLLFKHEPMPLKTTRRLFPQGSDDGATASVEIAPEDIAMWALYDSGLTPLEAVEWLAHELQTISDMEEANDR